MAKDAIKDSYDLVVIGGSAGSLPVIVDILSHIKVRHLSFVVLLHRKSSADSILTDLLGAHSLLPVKEAEEKEPIRPGTVYIAPPDYHLLIESDRSFSLDDSEKVNFSRPSIDVTFEACATVYGNRLAGVLLSGGNQDGAAGLMQIARRGGLTIVQDPASADVAFMPESAISLFRPDKILMKDDIAGLLNQM